MSSPSPTTSHHLLLLRRRQVLPVAYAQLTRLVCIGFVIIVPFSAYISLGWGVLFLSFAVNMIYFTVDRVRRSQPEAPATVDASATRDSRTLPPRVHARDSAPPRWKRRLAPTSWTST